MPIMEGMGSYEENYLKKRPQSLCKMCGKCCRVVTNTKYTYSEIKRLAREGNEFAKDFLKIFEPYPSIEAAREVDAGTVDNIIEHLKADGKYDEKNMTFYKCKYLLDNNLCSIYEERPVLCIHCPANGWVVVPPGCGFEGWLFLQREEDKQKVRHAKEEYLELQLLKKKNKNPEILAKIESVEKKIQHTIDIFKAYGSEDW